MPVRTTSGLWLTCLLTAVFLPSSLCASNFADNARQLAHRIAASSGPGVFAVEVTNRSTLDDKTVHEVRSALTIELQLQGVQTAKADQAIGSIAVVLSESLREYVWTAVIHIGSDEKKVILVSLARPPTATSFGAPLPITLKPTLLFAQQQPILDIAVIDMPGGSRLIVLEKDMVAIFRQQGLESPARWQLDSSLPITHTRVFPRDLRGRLLLRRDRVFDVYLPGTFCRSISSSSFTSPLTLACNPTDDPWPLTSDDASLRAFFASSRNFFTGALSPSIGKVSNVPSFYSAAALSRSGYTLWAFATVDGSLHFVDGITDQLIRGANWGSDLAAIHSACGLGTQLLISEGESLESIRSERDGLRAYEIPDRDPVPVSSATEFAGQVVALWPDQAGTAAVAVVRRKDTGWYEAYRISISCSN